MTLFLTVYFGVSCAMCMYIALFAIDRTAEELIKTDNEKSDNELKGLVYNPVYQMLLVCWTMLVIPAAVSISLIRAFVK